MCLKVDFMFILFLYENLIIPASFVEETILFPLNGLGTPVQNYSNNLIRFISGLSYSNVIYIPHIIEYCSFVVNAEMWKSESSSFVFPFQEGFGFLDSLAILYEF